MKTFISKSSHKILLISISAVFLLNFISYSKNLLDFTNQEIERKESEKSVRANGNLPHFTISEQRATNNSNLSKQLIAFFTFLISSLCLSKNKFAYFISGILLMIPLGHFVRWFIGTQQLLFWIENSDFITGTNRILFHADFIDFLSLSLISLLFIWLFSISVNNFYLNRKRKVLLP